MRYTLKSYQEAARNALLSELALARSGHAYNGGELRAVSLQAPTGAGKTVIAASVIEALLDGDGGPEDDDNAIILWLTTDPALNAQTRTKMLAASSGLVDTQLEVIENGFQARTFKTGHVYFLNTQKLSKGTKLDTGGTDARTYSLWDTIANTSREWGKHFYVVIDEAHVGVGGASDRSATTITRRIIDGAGGPAVPVVVGITATPRKFQHAMHTAGRTLRAVDVPIADVRASGLIKDGIILLAPGVKMKGLEYELIRRAGRRLEDYRQDWAAYAERTGGLEVNPAMVVQLGDTPSKAVLSATLTALRASIPGLAEDQIVHTFAEHADLSISGWNIGHCSPELIAGKTQVRVILAKSAITTGWDCPRAEVMVSLRKVDDTDLIAQIVGRTVRTPLAKRIEGDDRLNTVVAYLPFFNPAGLGAVAAALAPASDEAHAETAQAATEVTVDEVEVPDFGGEESFEDEHESMIFDEATPTQPADDSVFLLEEPDYGYEPAGGAVSAPIGGAQPGTATQVLDPQAPAQASPVHAEPLGHQAPAPVGPPAEQLDVGSQEELGVFREISAGTYGNLTIKDPEPEDGPIFFEVERTTPTVVLDTIKALPSYRLTEKTASAATKRLMELAVRLEQHRIAPNAQSRSIRALYRQMADRRDLMKLEGTWDAAFLNAAQLTLGGHVVDANGVTINGKTASETSLLSSEAITERFRKAERALAEQMAMSYLKLASKDRPSDDRNDILIEAIALAEDDEMKVQLENRAASFANELAKDYAAHLDRLDDAPRAQIEELMAALKTIVRIPMAMKTSEQDRKKGEWLEKHVISHKGGYRYNANLLEARVLDREIRHYAGWYRNPSTGKDVGLGIPCVDNTGEDQILRPDFIFVTEDGKVAIVDPHGGYLNDGVWKARGLAKYARENADLIYRAVIIDEINGQDRYLNLRDETVAAALETTKDIRSVYALHGQKHG